MDDKIIIRCNHCGKPIRIPANKHIRFACPQCGHKAEYMDGRFVIPTKRVFDTEPEVLESFPHKKYSAKHWWGVAIILLVAVPLVMLLSRHFNPGEPPAGDDPNTQMILPSNPVPPMPEMAAAKTESDSTFERMLQDFVHDMGEAAAEALLDKIKEASEEGRWEQADTWHRQTTDAMRRGGAKGKKLLKKYEGVLAQLKNDIVGQNPFAGELPESTRMGELLGEKTAVDEVTNETPYMLTLYYTGPLSKIVNIPAGETRAVKLKKGLYHVVAEADKSDVRPYRGTQVYVEGTYSCSYSISTRYGF